jgi:hypothetical protein
LAAEKKMMFFEASAKTADHVNECFMNLTATIVKELEKNQVKKRPDNPQPNIDLGKQSGGQGQRGKGGCC